MINMQLTVEELEFLQDSLEKSDSVPEEWGGASPVCGEFYEAIYLKIKHAASALREANTSQ